MSFIGWLASLFVLSVLCARMFCFFGARRGNTVVGADSEASIEERALAAAWARRFATKDLQ